MRPRTDLPHPPHFDGKTYDAVLDYARLGKQFVELFRLMRHVPIWWTLRDLSIATRIPTQSVSARLRDFRKEKFGSHTVERRRRSDPQKGLWEYRLILNPRTLIVEGGEE